MLAHLRLGVFGICLAFTVVWRTPAAVLVFANEFAQRSGNVLYMVNRSSVEQGVTQSSLRGRVQTSRMAPHAASETLGILLGGVLGEQFATNAAIALGVVAGLFSFAPVAVARPPPGHPSPPRAIASEAWRGGSTCATDERTIRC